MQKAKLLFTWLYRERKSLYSIYLLALLQGAMYLLIPIGIQGIVSFIMVGEFSASLILLSCITILVVGFIGFFQIWQIRVNETMHQKIFGRLVSKLNDYLITAKPKKNLLNEINKFNEVVTLQKGISKILLDFSFSLISIVFGLLILPTYSTWFLLFTISLGSVFYFIIRYYGSKGIETNIETSNYKYKIIEGFQKTAVLGVDEERSNETDILLNNYFSSRKSHFNILELQYKGIIIFKVVFISVLLFLGAFLVQKGQLTIGQFIASEIFIFLIINAVEKLVESLNTCYDIITALYKIEGIFSEHANLSFIKGESHLLSSVSNIYNHPYSRVLKNSIFVIFLAFFIILLMPWTQNVKSKGRVTTINPQYRPQVITSRIAGRVEKWYIKEGDFVSKNDTIAFISEIKDDYFDTQLIQRSESIIKSKETTIVAYKDKMGAVNSQIDALYQARKFKLEQAKNKIMQTRLKIIADSIDAKTSFDNFNIAVAQYNRYNDLLAKGIVSKTELENRKVKMQEAISKKTASENKFLATKNELLNAEIELNSLNQEYQEKLMKAESEKFSAQSLQFEGEGSLTKLQNQLSNYNKRKEYGYVLSPQDGYISKTDIQGLGEIIKEGSALCNIVPKQMEQAVELYVNPIDLPLIQIGQKVQIQFDGWPAFVFSGWPGVSYGSYSAEVVAYDRVLSINGKFRILAKGVGDKWPESIQLGGGVEGFAMLKNVPLFYELWRKLNGFPPEFYAHPPDVKDDKKYSK